MRTYIHDRQGHPIPARHYQRFVEALHPGSWYVVDGRRTIIAGPWRSRAAAEYHLKRGTENPPIDI